MAKNLFVAKNSIFFQRSTDKIVVMRTPVQQERIEHLNLNDLSDGRYVLYWMQQSQRAECNHALEHAISIANNISKPLAVAFGIFDKYPFANLRHFRFMLQGLQNVRRDLARRGITMVVRAEHPAWMIRELGAEACAVVTDRGYLRHQIEWRTQLAGVLKCPLIQVESDVVVPVEAVSAKEEYSAATIRPKIHRQLSKFLVPLVQQNPKLDSLGLKLGGSDLENIDDLLMSLGIDRSVGPAGGIVGGTAQAIRRLEMFMDSGLSRYDEIRNDPAVDGQSGLSPYLHFGQISPLYVALQVNSVGGIAKEFLEQLIVRRELAINFVLHNRKYNTLASLPNWATATLRMHHRDRRAHVYSLEEFELAQTHDPYWNAAQTEMVRTGKMHGYMRMYWGKKIIEWTRSPEDACKIAITLNDKYSLDGRDPNGYAGIMWCFGKHDRPWVQRPVFGMVRYMNEAGLERKFDPELYIRRVNATPMSAM